jgi:hypothetical protein
MKEETTGAKKEVPGSEHDPKSHNPVKNTTQGKIQQIFHQYTYRILRPGKTGLQQGKPRLHEHNQYGSKQGPYCIQGYPFGIDHLSIVFRRRNKCFWLCYNILL